VIGLYRARLKPELSRKPRRFRLGDRIVGVETTDKMTDHQIAAKVREHFRNP
jgi:hypothetical protein